MEERAANKAERLLQIKHLLLEHPEGLTQAEIARRIGVNRSTVLRYLPDLERFAIYETDDGRLSIDRDSYLTEVQFTLHEAMAVHLASRLMATTTDKHNPHAATALRKLAGALERFAPFVSRHISASADVMDEEAQRRDPVYLTVLQTLTQAWSVGRKVRLEYQMPDLRVFTCVFAPWYIEPYAAGRTAHVLGWWQPPSQELPRREAPGARRTLKIERIRSIELLSEGYTIPADFDPREELADAWGIWTSDEAPVEVVLRFSARVAVRVGETRWHRSQVLTPQADGSVIWRAEIAEPQEMLPWIRGWGADVEVLAPEEVREALVREVRRMALTYHVGSVEPLPAWQLLWAKLSRDKTQSHPLICHMLDVAVMASELWRSALTAGQRVQWAAMLALDEEAAGRLIAFWIGLHDLGKASPAFQRQHAAAESFLTAAGLPFPRLFLKEYCPHGRITTVTLPGLLTAETGLPRRAAARIGRALGGHHGAWPTPLDDEAVKSIERGGGEWDSVRQELLLALRRVTRPPEITQWTMNRADENAFLTWFSGLATTADWLGSMEGFFPYTEAPVDIEAYAKRAEVQAVSALKALHWTDWAPPATRLTFEDQFIYEPSAMQEAIVQLAEQLPGPALVLIEAPTGSGKTEAALYLADAWARTQQQRGLYVAMPTMATSNQMHGRVGAWLARRYPQSVLAPLLVHSQARWTTPPELTLHDEPDGNEVAAQSWFLPRKRSLLAPCAVGTVDQALMSVLQARHFFVRLFGLSRKTIVFDEIHAYDTYMSTLFQRLLGWLRAMGSSVILLSATLPEQTRRELLEAYAGCAVNLPESEYPAATWVTKDLAGSVPLPCPEDRPVTLGWIDRASDSVVEVLNTALAEGGCAAVICNTIARAQAVYTALKAAAIVPDAALILFHARYPFGWRDELEHGVLARFGKDGERPERAIVVATQVIEQSLDLDFDVMVSDLAPIDLLIQRVGRLHRHEGRTRPAGVSAPQLTIAVDVASSDGPDFGRDVWVYEEYLLLRTYLVLQGRSRLALPGESPDLLNLVYSEASLPGASPALEAARQRMLQRQDKDVDAARKRLVAQPTSEGLLSDTPAGLAEDDPAVHAAFQALTRLGPPSIALVCLHAMPGGLNTEPDGSGAFVDLRHRPDEEATRAIVRATLSVSRREVVSYYRDQDPPAGWNRHALLRDHRVAVFEGGQCRINESLSLRLSRELGLEAVSSSDGKD